MPGDPPLPTRAPPASPPLRPHSRWATQVLVGVLVLVILLLVGSFVYFDPLPGSDCTDWYVYCPRGPGATPLGTALEMGNGTGTCAPGNGSSALDCAYSFSVRVDPFGNGTASIPSASDLTFQLQNSAGARLNSSYLVTLASSSGSRLGTWSSSSSTWSTLAQSGTCGGSSCLPIPLSTGESFLLKAVPTGGLPYSHQADRLVLVAVGEEFSGWVDGAIT